MKAGAYRLRPMGADGFARDGSGTVWHEEKPGVHVAIFEEEVMQGANLKSAFILRQHVEAFVAHWKRAHTLFFTTTDAEGLGPKEYARRWNSLLANESKWILAFLRVLEPQRNGRPHFHNLVAVSWDTRPDAFDWDAFARSQDAYRAKDWAAFRSARDAYVRSAAPELRELWAWGRRVMPRYGLGRCEILPVRKEGAISEYVGKYLDKGLAVKIDAWKGVRRFESDRRSSVLWKRCGRRFSWVGWRKDKDAAHAVPTGAAVWRSRVRRLALAIGAPDDGDVKHLSRILGPRWAYRLRGVILTGTEEEFGTTLRSLSEAAGLVVAGPVEYDNGENAAW